MAADDILGFGLLGPAIRRDKKRDFAAAGGAALVRSAVEMVLGTVGASDFTQGELPWRTEFGTLLFLLRHQKNDVALQELAKVYVSDALRRWEPRVRVKSLTVRRLEDGEGNKLALRLRYDIVRRDVPSNEVLVQDVEQEVTM